MGPLNFIGTGSAPVDQVLWAVACAATDYHNTNEWGEPTYGGQSHVEMIQTAAKSAAAELDRLRAENAALRERVAGMERVRVAAENLDPADGSEDLSEALAAAKPAAQEGKEAADGN